MSPEILQLIAWSTLDTLVMVGLAGLFGTLLGLPLGIFFGDEPGQ
jgi:D-methionine transport system permease protein